MTAIIYITYVGIALIAAYLVSSIQVAFRQGLRQLPGPFLARFSGLYALSLVWTGKAPEEYRRVHEQYGQIVRIGPDRVSVSDPAMISVIYGIGSKFLKVWLYDRDLTGYTLIQGRLDFTLQ